MAINSKKKGNAGEKYVVELLKKWWDDEHFIRNFLGGSGAAGTQLAGRNDVSSSLLEAMTGDIICPEGFPFSIESKFYETIDLYEVMRNPEKATVVEFWRQCKNDADRIKKIPLVIMRENRKQAYCMFPSSFDRFNSNLGFSRLTFMVDGELVHIAAWNDFSAFYTKENVLELIEETKIRQGQLEHGIVS
jgi:hypothetical protein